MKKIIYAIFAHPDDEAFGPAGTLLQLKAEGHDIHLILLTDGEAGANPDNTPGLAATRLKEWQASAEILSASSTHAFHYPDSALENVSQNELDKAVSQIIEQTLKSYDNQAELSFMTFEPNGLTGHRDHVAASSLTARMATQFVAHETWYFCLDSSQAPLEDTAYYEPRAREDSYITKRVDVTAQLGDVFRMINAHESQRADGEKRKALGEERLSQECFRIET